MSNEAFARMKIDALLAAQGWDTLDTNAVSFEVQLPDGTRADYVLCDRHGRSLAVIEAKRYSISPGDAAAQAIAYAQQLGVPYAFLCNGEEVLFWEWQREAYPQPVKTIFKQDDLERRIATLSVRRDPVSVAIDRRIVERDYQIECIDTLCREIGLGRRKLLVEMATGTGKTRTAAAFFKRLFEANAITRVLFLVDRIPLAKQTEDAFAEHLPDYPAYVLRAGRRFQDEKRITITTLQSMVNLYAEYSSGYFDLVISDECHRSIYGQWSGVLRHFDGVQVGLTATPCVADPDSGGGGDDEDRAFVRDTLRFLEVEAPTFSYKLKTEDRDLQQTKDYEGIKALLTELYPDEKPKTRINWASQIAPFVFDIQPGDWVVVPHKHKPAIAFGEVTKGYAFDAKAAQAYRHSVRVNWLNTEVPRSSFDQDLLYSFGAFMTVCRMARNDAEARVRAMSKAGWRAQPAGAVAPAPGMKNKSASSDQPLVIEEHFDVERSARDQITKLVLARLKGHGMAELGGAILRAQGFSTHISPPGRDGGIDILAAPGTFGFAEPRICVQVKSQQSPIERTVLDALGGVMKKVNATLGLLVCWGGFKSASTETRRSSFSCAAMGRRRPDRRTARGVRQARRRPSGADSAQAGLDPGGAG